MKVAAVMAAVLLAQIVDGKIFGKCELQSFLKEHMTNVKTPTLEKTLCGVERGSEFDTSKVTEKNGWTWRGIFQISHHYCDPAWPGHCPGVTDCSKLTDEDISDDLDCVEHIRKHFLQTNAGALGDILKENFSQLFKVGCKTPVCD